MSIVCFIFHRFLKSETGQTAVVPEQLLHNALRVPVYVGHGILVSVGEGFSVDVGDKDDLVCVGSQQGDAVFRVAVIQDKTYRFVVLQLPVENRIQRAVRDFVYLPVEVVAVAEREVFGMNPDPKLTGTFLQAKRSYLSITVRLPNCPR